MIFVTTKNVWTKKLFRPPLSVLTPGSAILRLTKVNIQLYLFAVLRIRNRNRIRTDPKLLAGSGSDPDPK